MKFSKVIVREPSKSLVNGLTSQNLGLPNYEKAVEQHDNYICELKKAGVDVTLLAAQEEFPDSVFVEDTAVLIPEVAIVTLPGDKTRTDEVIAMHEVLKKFYKNISKIILPGTLDGGDVLLIDKEFYIGLSKRTNEEGIEQFRVIVEKFGYSVTSVKLKKFLHLKTGISFLGNNTVLLSGELKKSLLFDKFDKILVPDDEEYCANSIMINGKVFIPKGFPKTLKMLKDKNFDIVIVDTSEYRKIDGGLSCLSLRF